MVVGCLWSRGSENLTIEIWETSNFKMWKFNYHDLRNYRNKRETMLEIVSLMNH
jgi:hypothetical protein